MMTQDKHIAVLANPLAGDGRAMEYLGSIERYLMTGSIPHRTYTLHWPDDFTGFTDIWLIGGDGTLNFFVNRYTELSLPITFFDGGTGNDFHAALYGKRSLAAIMEAGLNAIPRPVDAGRCNGRYFMNGIGVGFDGNVAARMSRLKRKKGITGYWMSVVRNIFFYREQTCRIICSEFSDEGRLLMVNAMNGQRSGGGFNVTPDAVLDDGLFNVLVIPRLPIWMRLRYLPVIEKGRHTKLPFLRYFKTDRIRFVCAESMDAHLDGEYLSGREFEIAVVKGKFLFRY